MKELDILGGLYSIERLLAAVLCAVCAHVSSPLAHWLALAAALYFTASVLSFAWRVRWLVILACRIARGLPGRCSRRDALAAFATRAAPAAGDGQLLSSETGSLSLSRARLSLALSLSRALSLTPLLTHFLSLSSCTHTRSSRQCADTTHGRGQRRGSLPREKRGPHRTHAPPGPRTR